MAATEIVCLDARSDLKAWCGAGFEAHPDVRLLRPDEVADPARIEVALAFRPGPQQFDAYPNLRLICSAGAGVEPLLAHPRLPPDVPIVRLINPDQALAMAGYVAHHVTGWHRRLWEYEAQQQARVWRTLDRSAPGDCPVAVLGYGSIGATTGTALRALGYLVTGWASRARNVGGVEVQSGDDALADLLAQSRVVVNLLPLTPELTGLFDAERLATMRPDALLIQLGRGAHLVEPDLIAALGMGRPGGAVLDVTAVEPLPPESPLWTHPNVRITPHVAGELSPASVAGVIVGTVRAFRDGAPLIGLVDRARGY